MVARESKYNPQDEQTLFTEILDPALADDLLGFVMFAYPWGKVGSPLEHFKGPRAWQRECLHEIGEHIKLQRTTMAAKDMPSMWREATASGRGIGKSALVSWLTHWMMSTRLGSTTIIAANTEGQLKTRTFAEVKKWQTLAINGHWFDSTVLSVFPDKWFEELLKDQLQIDTGYYYAQGQLWSEENPDAFAGVHNPLGVQLIFDEASGIPKPIWTVAEGFFTEPVLNRYWNVYSNPRRNSGAFFDTFSDAPNAEADTPSLWRRRVIDARTVEGTDPKIYADIISQHGIDSDEARVEVLGLFPNQGENQFMSNTLVREAQAREVQPDMHAPLVMGVDIARQGKDSTVIRWRHGRDARSMPPTKLTGKDNMFVANEVARLIQLYGPDAVNIDAGNGTGVIDRLREMGYKVNEIWFGSKASNSNLWADKRTEMYAQAREWLEGGCIDDSHELFRDLTTPEINFATRNSDAKRLESKVDMRSRGLPSPDNGDAFVLTFATNVARRDARASLYSRRNVKAKGVDYPLFG